MSRKPKGLSTITGAIDPKYSQVHLDVMSECNTENRLRRHLIEHGVSISLSTQLSRQYTARIKTQEHHTWLQDLISVLSKFIPAIAMLFIACGTEPLPTTILWQARPGAVFRGPTISPTLTDNLIVMAQQQEHDKDHADTQIVGKYITQAGALISNMTPINLGATNITDAQAYELASDRLIVFFQQRPSGTASYEQCTMRGIINAMYVTSSDHGLTWSTPISIKDQLTALVPMKQQRLSPSTGFIRGGRIYLPGMSVGEETDCLHKTHLNDRSWIISVDIASLSDFRLEKLSAPASNESAIGLDSQNNLFIWSRHYNSAPHNRTLNDIIPTQVYAPLVHSGITLMGNEFYVSYPYGTERKNLVFHNLTTNDMRMIYAGPAGYSNIIKTSNGAAIVYEAGKETPYESIRYTTINLLTD